jgi:hypothetical protein
MPGVPSSGPTGDPGDEGGAVSLRLSAAELAVLLGLLGGAGPAAPERAGGGDEPGRLAAAQESLRARRLIARGEDGGVRIDSVALALLGTCLRPAARLRVVTSGEAEGRRESLIHFLAELAVEQRTAAGAHRFTGYTSPPALVRRLMTLAGVGRQPRPEGAPMRIRGETVRAALAGAGEAGAPGVRRALAAAGIAPRDALGLTRALVAPRRLTRFVAFAYPRGGRRPVPLGGVDLVEGPSGFWGLSGGPPGAPGGEGVDVRPLSGAEAEVLLARLVAALGWRGETAAPEPRS